MSDPMEDRLAAAELVCHLFGWSPSRALGGNATDVEKAAHEAWSVWYELCGRNIERRPAIRKNIEAQILILAARRDATRSHVLAIIDQQADGATSGIVGDPDLQERSGS